MRAADPSITAVAVVLLTFWDQVEMKATVAVSKAEADQDADVEN
jgi:hypothetical protein